MEHKEDLDRDYLALESDYNSMRANSVESFPLGQILVRVVGEVLVADHEQLRDGLACCQAGKEEVVLGVLSNILEGTESSDHSNGIHSHEEPRCFSECQEPQALTFFFSLLDRVLNNFFQRIVLLKAIDRHQVVVLVPAICLSSLILGCALIDEGQAIQDFASNSKIKERFSENRVRRNSSVKVLAVLEDGNGGIEPFAGARLGIGVVLDSIVESNEGADNEVSSTPGAGIGPVVGLNFWDVAEIVLGTLGGGNARDRGSGDNFSNHFNSINYNLKYELYRI